MLVETPVMDHCGPYYPGYMPPQLDVSLYRISTSGAVTVILDFSCRHALIVFGKCFESEPYR